MPFDDDRNTFDDERETQPDLEHFPCPGCVDEHGAPQGEIQVTKWTSETAHTTKLERCDVCKGAKRINRERLAWWRAQPR